MTAALRRSTEERPGAHISRILSATRTQHQIAPNSAPIAAAKKSPRNKVLPEVKRDTLVNSSAASKSKSHMRSKAAAVVATKSVSTTTATSKPVPKWNCVSSYQRRSRSRRAAASCAFDYDLSQVEQRNFGHCHHAMKSVPDAELQLLRSGQRATYLETRYERCPELKYHYPEATSWRYGWFHNQCRGDASKLTPNHCITSIM
ncbi:uncharacterized protein LOC115634233 [Scaptodrosophila lebanonensis]|uniref:Uncharacterized protein LOC115634233 n=1 Tax=Drosophila lebanonensis TaxID=7225 RepID=A0A6J2UHS2_DROLE|nr:uncharacterized protein LOC115634233 [Scaptodrosophila lebanonensis]